MLGDGARRARAGALRPDAARGGPHLRRAVPALPAVGDAIAALRDRALRARSRSITPNYPVEAPLPPALRDSLVADLDADPAPLLAPLREAASSTRTSRCASASGRVRVRRPDQPAGRGHVVVEPALPIASWLDADPGIEAELLAEVKRCAGEVIARHGACRVLCDLHASRLRWHVFAPEP